MDTRNRNPQMFFATNLGLSRIERGSVTLNHSRPVDLVKIIFLFTELSFWL